MTNFGEYRIKKLKSFMGTDGYGYNCDLYRGSKKVATCIHDGGGGEVMMYWVDSQGERVEHTTTIRYGDRKGEPHTYKTTIEEHAFLEHLKTLPPLPSEYSPEGLEFDADLFMGELVEQVELEKDFNKGNRKAWLFVSHDCKKGEYRTITRKQKGYTFPKEKVVEHLDSKYGQGNYTIIETFEQFSELVSP